MGRPLFDFSASFVLAPPGRAGAASVAARLRRLAHDQGAAVLIADHHVAEALDLCDRAALLLGGEVAITLPPADFRRSDLVRAHYAVLV